MYPQSTLETFAANPFFAAAVLVVFGIIFLLALKDRRYVLFGYLFFLPLTGMPMMSGRLAGIPGLSVQNIVMGLGLYAILLTRSHKVRMDRNLRVVLILYWVVVIEVVLRGLFHLDELNRLRIFADLGGYDYLRSYLFSPILAWLSFLAAYRYASAGPGRAAEYLRYTGVATLGYAALALASVGYYFARVRDFNEVRDLVTSFLGSHSNEYSIAFVMIVPFLFAGIMSKKTVLSDRILFSAALICSGATVLFSYSRSGYVGLALTAFGFALLVKRSLLWILIPVVVGLVLFGPASVIERAEFGFKSAQSQNTPNLDYISSGRLGMAEAALETITSSFGQLVFGDGRLTFPRATHDKFGVGHPHNAYLETLLDAGIVGFVFIVALFLLMFSRTIKGVRRLRRSEYRLYYAAAAVSLGCYLLMGFSGRSFFPSPQLMFVWQVAGFALGLIRYDIQHLPQQVPSSARVGSPHKLNDKSPRTRTSSGSKPKCVV